MWRILRRLANWWRHERGLYYCEQVVQLTNEGRYAEAQKIEEQHLNPVQREFGWPETSYVKDKYQSDNN